MAQIHFLIRSKKKGSKVPIYVRIFAGRNNESYGKIPRFVIPKYWDSKNEKVKQLSGFDKEDYSDINESLFELKAFLFKELYKQTDNGLPIDGEWLKKSINLFFTSNEVIVKPQKSNIIAFIDYIIEEMEDGKIYTKDNNKYAPGTINGYRQLKTKLNEFTNNKALPFNRINMQFGKEFLSFLTEQDLLANYIGKIFSRLKSTMNIARKKGYLTNIDYAEYKVSRKDVINIYLSIDELKQIQETDLKGNKDYELARDIFLFGCFIGQRVSDYNIGKKFKTSILKTNDGRQITLVTIIQKKTNTKLSIPLRSEPLKILEKYNFKIPYMTPQKINKNIKEIGKIAGIDEPIEIRYTRGGVTKVETKLKYKLIKTHTARRSMITNMVIEKSLSRRQMMLISGHKTEKDFNNYVKSAYEEELDDIINAAFFNH